MLSNEKLMTIISDAKRSLVLFWNAGKVIVTKKVDLKRYGTVWFHAEGIANILCLMCRKVTKLCMTVLLIKDSRYVKQTVLSGDLPGDLDPPRMGYSFLMLKMM